MYVIIMKDMEGGVYLSEQILFYGNRDAARDAARNLIRFNRDTCYSLIKVDLSVTNYREYKKGTHDIIYEGELYCDIDRCILSGNYEDCTII